MELSGPPLVPPDPLVRRVRREELDILLPASVAMFTEEVGVSPLGPDGGGAYRARVRELIDAGRAYARIEDGRVVFKAEIGSVTPHACQVQGVWGRPELRGRRLAEAGIAAPVTDSRRPGRGAGGPARPGWGADRGDGPPDFPPRRRRLPAAPQAPA